MKPILYLEIRQFVNAVKLTIRSPKRLIPALVFGVWFCFVFVSNSFSRGGLHHVPAGLVPEMWVERLWSSVFALGVLITIWLLQRAFSESLIVFGMPEVDFVFPTPIRRRVVMSLKLLKMYVKLGLYLAFIIYFISGPMQLLSMASGRGPSMAVGWFGALLYGILLLNVYTIINLIVSCREDGRWWLAYVVRGVAYGLILLAVVVAAVGYLRTGNIADSLALAVTQPVFIALMLPVRWAADLMVSPFIGWQRIFGIELAALGLLAAASYVLVLLRKENPYEPSLSISARSSAARAAIRSGDWSRARAELLKSKPKASRPKFGIPPFGRGAVAVVWKNLNVLARSSGAQIRFAIALIVVAVIMSHAVVGQKVTPRDVELFVIFGLLYVMWLFSAFMMQGFRADLKQVNILKPIPIPAWKLILAEIAHGVVLVSLGSWLLIALVAIVYGTAERSLLPLAAISFPFVALSVVSSQAAVTVLYPSWEDASQRFLGSMLGMLAGGLAIGPPVALGAVLWAVRAGTVLTALVVTLSALGISIGGIALGSYAYKRHDPTSE
jgi:hypothetical protein